MKTYWLMHSHHEGPLLELSWDPKERYDYILREKPKEELDLRLALFAVIPDDVVRRYFPNVKAWEAHTKAWEACIKAREAYIKAREAHTKAWEAYIKAREAHTKAWEAYIKAWEACIKAREAYIKAREAYIKAGEACDWERLHRDLCWPWCPGVHIFAKGTNLNDLVQAYEQDQTAKAEYK